MVLRIGFITIPNFSGGEIIYYRLIVNLLQTIIDFISLLSRGVGIELVKDKHNIFTRCVSNCFCPRSYIFVM